MILSSRHKVDQPMPRSLRPSLFLNEFDFTALSQTNPVKTEGNQKQKQKTEITQQLTEQSSIASLPAIEEKVQKKKKDLNITKEQKEFLSQNMINFTVSEQTSPQLKSDIRLPLIQQTPQPKALPRHSRVLTNEDLKKVNFRPSILVIDFVNGNFMREKIDGSVKPLTKKLARMQTKFIK